MEEATYFKNGKVTCLILCAILIIAFFFRFYSLADLPPAMAIDEAVNGIKAQEALSTGDYKFFYSITPLVDMQETFAHEGLYINILTLSLSIFGRTSTWAVRMVSALIGTLTILGFFLSVREFLRWSTAFMAGANKRPKEGKVIILGRSLDITLLALIAAFLLAVSFWHVLFSRIGFHAILTPCTTAFALYFLFRALRSGTGLLGFITGGFFMGLVFHTYLSNRVVPFIALAAMSISFTRIIRKKISESEGEVSSLTPGAFLKNTGAYWGAWLVTVSPILLYFYSVPGDFLHRAKALSVYEETSWPVVILKNFLVTLGQFNFRGDEFIRHNIPGAPELLWPVGLFFILGLILCLIATIVFSGNLITRKKELTFPAFEAFLLIWFIVTLAPAFLSSGPHPHAHRGLNAVLPALLIASLGGLFIFEFIRKSFSTGKAKKTLALGSIIILIIIGAGEYKRYFHDWAGEEELNTNFNENYFKIAGFINDLPQEVTKFIVVDTHFSMSVQFLTDTYVEDTRKEKKIVYILPNKPVNIDFREFRPYVVIPLLYKPELYKTLKEIVPGRFVPGEDFDYFVYD